MQNRRLQIVNMHRVLHHMKTQLVGLAQDNARFDSTPGHPHRKGLRMMIAPRLLGAWCAAKLGAPHNKGFVQQYDFAGTLLKAMNLPGISATAGSCYTPSFVTADPNGDFFVADNTCQHVLKYSQAGSLLGDWPAANWTSGYSLQARGLWTDERASLYINQPVCGASGCQPGVVKLDGSANLLTKVTGDSNAGCAWNERILYLAGPASGPLRRDVYNTPPSVPTETYPIGPVVQHSSSAVLAWQYAADSEGDSVLYTVSLGTSPLGLAPVPGVFLAAATQPASGPMDQASPSPRWASTVNRFRYG